ncbi:glycosyltransferase [Pseudomonas knackmussii]|uniref:Glycosyltransferase n=1 Tax=Pseudomonas knackmussii TaxID=65741 RepID=A0ABY4KM27_9PSED|nr:glycosyltransferase [Pseudomonas knackmussii]UPQ81326.1 glycosyltransferase [Pseudomonas knackmussii]
MTCSVSEATAIILTTYNPCFAALKDNLESYICQVGRVVLCDNSDNEAAASQIEAVCSGYESAIYLSMGGNKGIAAAQNAGIELAISLGYQYFIEIDQDSKLGEGYVSGIVETYLLLASNGLPIAGVGPIAVSKEQDFVYHGYKHDSGIHFSDKTLSSGFFFSKCAYQLVGGKDEGLFIDLVDWDWCWRARSKFLYVAVDTSVRIEHMMGDGHKKILGYKVGLPAPIRLYYQYRNSLYLLSKPHVPFGWKVKRVIILAVKIPYYYFCTDRRAERVSYIFRGVLSALRVNMGAFRD